MNVPKVTIVTVVYNAEKLLENTILSVINQNYDSFEYIIIDGGSKDKTISIIKKYSEQISFWISKKDDGLYDAMNKGLALAKGEYIWFLHAGDTIPNENTLKNAIEKCPDADVIYGDTRIIDPETGAQKNWYKKKPNSPLTYHNFLEGMVVCHQSILIKRDCAAIYDLKWQLAGDIDWCIRSFQNVKTACDTGEVMCYFLGGGISTKRKRQSLIERFFILKHHFGLKKTLLQHTKFVFSAVFGK